MKKKFTQDIGFQILLFLGIFGFSIGLFSNFRELWMSTNGIDTTTISRIVSISSIVTVFVLLFFTIKVNTNKLKHGISVSLVLKLVTSTLLICLNDSQEYFLIKFIMFFDIAFTELILSSIYPFMMNVAKNDIAYTKKGVVESITNKIGFLVSSILLGRVIGSSTIDYNICFLLSVIFCFLAFIIFIRIDIDDTEDTTSLDIKKAIYYFWHNKKYIYYLGVIFLGGAAWCAVLGMPLLSITTNLEISSQVASFLVLGLGIISNILAMLVVKYFCFKNDHINLIFKYGIRYILYILVIIFGTKEMYLIAIIYLLLSDCPYGFILSARFIHEIDEEYSLLLVVLKYCANLMGNGLGILICGLTFNLELKYIVIPALVLGLIHYIAVNLLIRKR